MKQRQDERNVEYPGGVVGGRWGEEGFRGLWSNALLKARPASKLKQVA